MRYDGSITTGLGLGLDSDGAVDRYLSWGALQKL
jgi:hypothetical protein